MQAVYYILAILFLILVGVVAYYIRKKGDTDREKDPFMNGVNGLAKRKFLVQEEVYFQEFMASHLSKDLMIFPQIPLSNIIMPVGNKTQYNAVSDRCVDFCIFLKEGMMPVLVIDLVYNGYSERLIPPMDKTVIEALKLVRIPILTVNVQDFYVASEVIGEINRILKIEPQEETNRLTLK